MDLSYLTNIRKVNYEETIKETIKEVRETYKDLSTDRTCMLYSSFINEKLREKHIISRIISTKDLGLDYEHRFVLAKDNEQMFLIDLTYRQFFDKINDEFKMLDIEGYQKVDNDILKDYIISFSGAYLNIDINSLFYNEKAK